MLTYQLREHSLLREEGGTLDFPNKVYIEFLFCPTEAFGKHSGKGRTVLRGSRAIFRYDANTGRVYFDSEPPLKPLDVKINTPDMTIRLRGNQLYIRTYCENVNDLVHMIEGVYYGLPPVINLNVAESPIIKRVKGKVGKTTFCWAHKRQERGFEVTDQKTQEEKIVSAWINMELLSTHPARRRILGALQHFYAACELSEAGNSPSDFVAEVILNYCKILEVLFPPEGDGRTRDAVRIGLAKLGYSEDEIESNFMPAMALRNEIDVGHTKLCLFNRKQLNILHKYTDVAEGYFRSMLSRLIERLKVESDLLAADPGGIVDRKIAKLIHKIGASLPKNAIIEDNDEKR
jgi:hypothetical protein